MKIEMGKKYRTRDGRDVKIYEIYDDRYAYYAHGAFYQNSTWFIESWGITGTNKDEKLSLVEVKDDWEIAEGILKKRKTIFLKIGNEIYLVEKLDEHDLDDSLFVTCHNENYIGVFKKEEIKLATKEEVIEYFFGSENEN